MAAKARIFSIILLVCIILPSLASAFSEFLEHDSRKKDGNNVVRRNDFGHILSRSDEMRKERSIKEKKKHKKGKKYHEDEIFNFDYFGDQQEADESSPLLPTLEHINGLQVGFYQKTCPQVEEIIKNGLMRAFQNDSTIAAAFPRLFLHDCFVNGCDGSVLLDTTPSDARVEKLAGQNGITVRGFEVIDQIKIELEQTCPGIVSCSDILAYLSRDAFVISGLPNYNVLAGRRDGMESLEANVAGNLPQPDETVDQMIELFKRKGLNEEDLVVLIGAHSIGVAHCFNFLYRLDDPVKARIIDPRLAGVMRFTCTNQMSTIAFDATTQYKMDSVYYKQLMMKRGLLESDELLAEDPRTKAFVKQFGDDEMGWFDKFGKAMNKLGEIQVLTGNEGQIRKKCRAVN